MTKTVFLTIALVTGAMSITLSSCNDQSEEIVVASIPNVKVTNIIEEQVTETGEWFGYLRGAESTTIRPRVTGFLKSQDYKNGQLVKKGDILFTIDQEIFLAELEQKQANLKAAEANYAAAKAGKEKATIDLTRNEKLILTFATSEKELDDSRQIMLACTAAEARSLANIDQMKAAIKKAQINLDYSIIHAPFNGIVGTALVSKGDLISSSTNLANISSISPIRVDLAVNSDLILSSLRANGGQANVDGQDAKFELVLEDGSIYEEKGTIKSLDSKIDKNGIIAIVGSIPNSDRTLRPGLPVRVRIPMAQIDALLVPAEAIRTTLRNKSILIVDKQGRPVLIPITLKGDYDISIKEANGYQSVQKLTAIGAYDKPLREVFKSYGYNKASDVPVINDKDNFTLAINISARNSRITELSKTKADIVSTTVFSYKPSREIAKLPNKGEASKNPSATLPLIPVKFATLIRQDTKIMGEWYGSLRGVNEAYLRPHISGFILTKNFVDGAIVQKDDTLFTIDPASFNATLDEANANLAASKASLQETEASLEMANLDYARYVSINKKSKGVISEKTVTDSRISIDMSKADVLKAKASIAQLKALVEQAKISLSYTIITAPFTGRVGIANPSIGDLVSPSDREDLVSISSINPIRIDFQVSGLDALKLLKNIDSKKKNPQTGEVKLILDDGKPYTGIGHVVSADNSLSISKGTLGIIAHIDNPRQVLRSGMPVRVITVLEQLSDSYLVPARATMDVNGMSIIMILNEDNTPQALPISKGKIVILDVMDANGKKIKQPMQIIDLDRKIATAMALAGSASNSLEEIFLNAAKVKSWDQLLLRNKKAASFEALIQSEGLKLITGKDAKSSYLKAHQAADSRSLILAAANAKDELDLIAKLQGADDALDMVLRKQGFKNWEDVRVIAEGNIGAGMVMQTNKQAGAPVNKLNPMPFHYVSPKTVLRSITAENSSQNTMSPTDNAKAPEATAPRIAIPATSPQQ